ncbi:hypothetical protein JCM9279_005890 [Rhodotorula babjevae]
MADPAPAQPAALRLPVELWIRVLVSSNLSYFDLHRFSRVCKHFRHLQQNSQLDSRLFRRGYPAGRKRFGPRNHPAKKGRKIAFHPVLNLVSLSRPDLDEADIACYGSRSGRDGDDGDGDAAPRYYKPLDFPVANEFATSPPCAKLSFRAGTEPVIADAGGVRVRSVIEVVTAMWASPAPAEYKMQELLNRGMFQGGEGVEDSQAAAEMVEGLADEVGSMTMWETLGDNTFWAGMRRAVCVEDGFVALEPKPFD